MNKTEDRFWSRVAVHVDSQQCYEWVGSVNAYGYGNFWADNKSVKAHRYSFYLHNGFYPEIVRHTCDNPCCVNPKHLLAGTHADNMKDASERGRTRCQKITHCPRGHEYTNANTIMNRDNQRVCRECNRVRSLANYYRRKELNVTR